MLYRRWEEKRNDYGRVLLSEQRKLASFPDLLDNQKKWFDQFLNCYIHELFNDILPIQYVAGDQTIILSITDIVLEMPTITVDEAKKTEKNYSGILKWKLKLINETSWELLFDKVVNIAMLPVLTQNYSYIINFPM